MHSSTVNWQQQRKAPLSTVMGDDTDAVPWLWHGSNQPASVQLYV
jgi:hypothetical protein